MDNINREFEQYMSNLGEVTNYAGDGVYQSPRVNRRFDDFRAGFQAARATPPSPSTAPEATIRDFRTVAEGGNYSELVDWLVARGMGARHPDATNPGDEHFPQGSGVKIKDAAALASRPAEVDDEGLPPLPQPMRKVYERPHGVQELLYFTDEQYRQGQRDAVAADRARRGGGQ